MSIFHRRLASPWRFLPVLSLAFFVGCVDRGDEVTSQAFARVNDRELTAHELDYELARLGVVDEATSQPGREVAVSLVERVLLAERAIEMEFDRDPTVVFALRSARDQVLADAYLSRTVTNVAPPSEEERREYYLAHPELFAQRRGYHFVEMIAGEPITADEVRSAIAQHGSMEGLVGWLQQRNAVFATREVYATSESISAELLAALSPMRPSQMASVAVAPGVHAVQLIDAAALPLSFEAVREQIGELLFEQAQQRAAASEIERIKASARISWEAPYSDPFPVDDDGAENSATARKHVERGLEGL